YLEHLFFPSFGSSLYATCWKAKFQGKLTSTCAESVAKWRRRRSFNMHGVRRRRILLGVFRKSHEPNAGICRQLTACATALDGRNELSKEVMVEHWEMGFCSSSSKHRNPAV
ncbi:hypothetical protein, partial [Burkholderia ubonensis]|uniref:hypothetical protein n=1 Tax=Burkholderia ubonensis TaxID=101571 RepID=UPI001E2DCF7F